MDLQTRSQAGHSVLHNPVLAVAELVIYALWMNRGKSSQPVSHPTHLVRASLKMDQVVWSIGQPIAWVWQRGAPDVRIFFWMFG